MPAQSTTESYPLIVKPPNVNKWGFIVMPFFHRMKLSQGIFNTFYSCIIHYLVIDISLHCKLSFIMK